MANFYKRPFIYLPKKKKVVEKGEVSTNNTILTYQRAVPSSSSSSLAFIAMYPRLWTPSWMLEGKQVWLSRTGSAYEIIILRLHTYTTGPTAFVTAANNVKFVCSHNLTQWACAYVWYVKSQSTTAYHLKDSSKTQPYEIGISLSTDNNYQTGVMSTTPIANIEGAQAFRDIQKSGSLIFADKNIADSDILPYLSGLGYGTKTAIVDLDIAS